MDFNDTPEEAAFRAEARAWLDRNAEKREPGRTYRLRRGEEGLMPLAREWERKKFEGGFAGIAIAKEYGGRGGTRLQQIIYLQEEANYVTPPPVFSAPFSKAYHSPVGSAVAGVASPSIAHRSMKCSWAPWRSRSVLLDHLSMNACGVMAPSSSLLRKDSE